MDAEVTTGEAAGSESEETAVPITSRRSVWRDLLKNPTGLLGLGLLAAVIAAVSLAPSLAPYDPTTLHLNAQFEPVGTPGYWLGTDAFGRDLLSRVLWGGRISLVISLAATAAAMGIGVPTGLVVGYFGRYLDNVVMRIVDVLLAFPYLLLAIVIVGALGPGLTNATLAVAVSGIPFYVRLVRGLVISMKEKQHVEAARAIGASDLRIMFQHIFPMTYPYLIVQSTLNAGYILLAVSGLSFLGLGAQPPSPEWGAMLADNRQYIVMAPQTVLVPGCAILVVVLALNLVGDVLRDVLDVAAAD